MDSYDDLEVLYSDYSGVSSFGIRANSSTAKNIPTTNESTYPIAGSETPPNPKKRKTNDDSGAPKTENSPRAARQKASSGDAVAGADDHDITVASPETLTPGSPNTDSHSRGGRPSAPIAGRVRRHLNARKAFQRKDELCTACKNLELTLDNFVIDHRRSDSRTASDRHFLDKRIMGTFAMISRRTACPLCRLLVESMTQISNTQTVADRQCVQSATCALHWAVDGLQRISEGERQHRTLKRTRRLAIEWSHNADEKIYIVLVAPEGHFSVQDGSINKNDDSERPMIFLGRLLTAIDRSSLDLIRHWLDICREHHADECQVPHDLKARVAEDLRSPTFTVIDVRDMCLTHLPQDEDEDARYVALSYTWGEESRISGGHGPAKSSSKERFKTLKANVEQLEAKNGIKKVLEGLPMAIQNAIYLTRKLGYRYLWVDSLCIIQNDRDSWVLNAEVMDVVYGNADFTICAADGEGSDKVGLRALFPPTDSKYARHAEQFTATYPLESAPSLQLMLSRPSESYIAPSRWNNRAWTFQERLLSRRCLIFVAGRMYLQCRTTTMSEDIYSEYALAGWSVELLGAPAHTLKRLVEDPITVYKDCLSMYTSRQLTHDEDILAAFNGIANMIRSALAEQNAHTCPFVFGLPPSHFDWALLWEPDEVPQRRLPSKGKEFPSWSWSGWKGKDGNKISYRRSMVKGPEIDLHEWLMEHTWITWYIRNGRGELRLLWDPLRHKANSSVPSRWKGYASPGNGLPLGSWACKDGEDQLFPEFDFHGRPFNKELPSRGRVEHLGYQFQRGTDKFRRYINVLKPGKEGRPMTDGPSQDKTFLQFWTYSADFFLAYDELPESPDTPSNAGERRLKRFAILDADYDKVGICLLEPEGPDAVRTGERQRFIAISDARDFDASEGGHFSQYNDNDVPWQLYNVMMLSCPAGDPDKEIAYRAGLGKVYKSAFPNGLNYGWKEIILG